MKQGQILILVLLVVVVVLAIGLSVASRNITNLRTSTQTEQSQRAFTAAEGGVEGVLSNLPAYSPGTPPSGCSSAVDTVNCKVKVGGLDANVQVKSSRVYQAPIQLGNVAQINLVGFSGNSVNVEWAIKNDQIEVLANGSAAVEISLVYGSPYQVQRWYFPGNTTRVGENAPAGSNPAGASSTCTPTGFEHCVVISLSSFNSPQILRIRPFFTKTTAKVAGFPVDLSPQTYDVSSSATTEIGVTRKVQVTRTALPQLPAVFDYALYSENNIEK